MASKKTKNAPMILMFIKRIFMLGLIILTIGFIFLMTLFISLLKDIPDPNTIATRQVNESTKIFDHTGESLLYSIQRDEKRIIITWEDIPESIKEAVIASEDSDFYNHYGLDFKGIARAFIKNISAFEISQGGSTITQQLVKKALLGDERTIPRKLKELILTVEIERRFTKDQILWMYLNQIPFGSNIFGIEAASQNFFDKPTKNLTIAESAIISSLIKAPTYYSPYGNHTEDLFARQKSILNRMKELRLITREEFITATEEKIEFKRAPQNIQAPHFVIMVREYLIQKYGEDTVEKGGFKVVTTLDAELQLKAEELVAKYGEANEIKYKSTNAALTAINPKNGHILVMVGSRDYFDIENEGNFNVALAKRQPGSAFKPFVYAAALNNGFPDSTVVFDTKTEFNSNCSPTAEEKKDRFGLDCYHPQNYDGLYRGPVTMRQSLAQSLNVPSVKFLYLAGIDQTIDLAKNMGISTLDNKDRFGLSLVLGGAEVKLLDITSAYGVFANDGIRNPAAFILRVEDSQGNILEEWKQNEKRVLNSQTARMITDMLSDNFARTPIFGANSPLYIKERQVAAKTGTTQENKDGWLIGYTPSLSVGVWTGNNNNTPMTRQGAGVSAAGPLWNEFMREALNNVSTEEFVKPNPITSDKQMLNGMYEMPPNTHNILYYLKPSDPLFENWESSVRTFFGLTNEPLNESKMIFNKNT